MQVNDFINRYLDKVQKPAWYSGGEYNSVVKDKEKVDIRYAFCFPDMYDVGMSHLGMKILYHMLNERVDTWCERVFAPNTDMENLMRINGVSLYGLESRDEIKTFDFIGFTLQYEMCYTNILNMLNLAGVPLMRNERTDNTPIIMCGGPCACNPEPLYDFVDLFFIGEGEQYFDILLDLYKETGSDKKEFLRKAAQIDCMYVPEYSKGKKIKRAIIQDLDNVYYPDKFVVPYAEIVHDRIMLEIMRGCIRGCRFCQAGMIYRPYRQKSPETLYENAVKLCKNTGYDEISLTSLSTSDYAKLPELADSLLNYCIPQHINLSLPSLRVDNFTEEILKKTQAVRKSGLTFAPEAGTQRLRDVINKNVTNEEIMNTCGIAFRGGASSVKLYFMIGLPTETDEDLRGIADTAQSIIDLYYEINGKSGRGITVTISLSTFVPKPFTPFQWESQISLDEIERKQKYLLSCIKSRKIKVNYHDGKRSVMEGIFARGDRRLGRVLLNAWENGCKFDAWDEHFNYDTWMKALNEEGLSVYEYASRKRDFDEALPWDIIDTGVTKEYLIRECKKAYNAETSSNCMENCLGCGANKLCKGDVCN